MEYNIIRKQKTILLKKGDNDMGMHDHMLFENEQYWSVCYRGTQFGLFELWENVDKGDYAEFILTLDRNPCHKSFGSIDEAINEYLESLGYSKMECGSYVKEGCQKCLNKVEIKYGDDVKADADWIKGIIEEAKSMLCYYNTDDIEICLYGNERKRKLLIRELKRMEIEAEAEYHGGRISDKQRLLRLAVKTAIERNIAYWKYFK